jgi:hypothetical protein
MTDFHFDFGASVSRAIRLWSDPIMQADGYDANLRGNVGQFAVVSPYVTHNGVWEGTFSSNQIATPLTSADLLKISMLQTIEPGTTLQAKMNWLMYAGTGNWGAPMQANYPSSSQWAQATNIKMIAAVYAGQEVEVVERKVIRCTFNAKTADVPMSRIKTYAPSEWSNPRAMMLVSVVDADNRYGEMPNANVGRVRLPIWFGTGREAWLFDRWLV